MGPRWSKEKCAEHKYSSGFLWFLIWGCNVTSHFKFLLRAVPALVDCTLKPKGKQTAPARCLPQNEKRKGHSRFTLWQVIPLLSP